MRRIALLCTAGISVLAFAGPAQAETRTVLSSSPAKGENLPAGTKVALTVAKK